MIKKVKRQENFPYIRYNLLGYYIDTEPFYNLLDDFMTLYEEVQEQRMAREVMEKLMEGLPRLLTEEEAFDLAIKSRNRFWEDRKKNRKKYLDTN